MNLLLLTAEYHGLLYR